MISFECVVHKTFQYKEYENGHIWHGFRYRSMNETEPAPSDFDSDRERQRRMERLRRNVADLQTAHAATCLMPSA
jgi:hypothetical protein